MNERYVKDKSGFPFIKDGFFVNYKGEFVAILKDEFAPGLPPTDLLSQSEVNDFLRVLLLNKTDGVSYLYSTHKVFTGTIVAGQLVVRINREIMPYDATNIEHADMLIGVALSTANAGEFVNVQSDGVVKITGFGLVQDTVYFAGPNGSLITSTDGMAFSHLIGHARNEHALYYQPQAIYIL